MLIIKFLPSLNGELLTLLIQNELYKYTNKYIYHINIDNIDYNLYYDDINLEINPSFTAHRIMESLQLNTNEFIQYLEQNSHSKEIINLLKKTNKYPKAMLPSKKLDKYMWIFLFEDDKLLASITLSPIIQIYSDVRKENINIVYVTDINSYVSNKGYCKIICNELMKFLNEWKVDIIYIMNAGGIYGGKCYLHSFLHQKNSFNYIGIGNDHLNITFSNKDDEIDVEDTISEMLLFFNDMNLMTIKMIKTIISMEHFDI